MLFKTILCHCLLALKVLSSLFVYQDIQPTSVFSPCWSLSQCANGPIFGISLKSFFIHSLYQSKPALKSVHTSGHDAGKDRKKPKPEERISSPPPCDASTPENGVEDKVSDQLNGDKEECRALFQLESAFSSDSKTCNSNPHLNTDSSFHRGVGLESAVLQREG